MSIAYADVAVVVGSDGAYADRELHCSARGCAEKPAAVSGV
jgi:hypothetical protein